MSCTHFDVALRRFVLPAARGRNVAAADEDFDECPLTTAGSPGWDVETPGNTTDLASSCRAIGGRSKGGGKNETLSRGGPALAQTTGTRAANSTANRVAFFGLAAVRERQVGAEGPVSRTFDRGAVSGQPAAAVDDHHARGDGRRGRVAADHRTPSVRRLRRPFFPLRDASASSSLRARVSRKSTNQSNVFFFFFFFLYVFIFLDVCRYLSVIFYICFFIYCLILHV